MGILVRQHGNTWFAKLNEEWIFDSSLAAYLEDKNISFVENVNGSMKIIKMVGAEFSTESYPIFVKTLLELVGFKEKFGKVKYRGEVSSE
jgi:hypothetical protein